MNTERAGLAVKHSDSRIPIPRPENTERAGLATKHSDSRIPTTRPENTERAGLATKHSDSRIPTPRPENTERAGLAAKYSDSRILARGQKTPRVRDLPQLAAKNVDSFILDNSHGHRVAVLIISVFGGCLSGCLNTTEVDRYRHNHGFRYV